ncbi:MAG: glycosyltransferase [Candidatus Electrothrix sp. AW3_4]|nr:glycosyltransferase [Candidatus Electrothrix gigas]
MKSTEASCLTPDVSVLIPTHNYGHLIEETLASIYSQKGVTCEIIIVDDGSTDSTPDILSQHADNITYIRQPCAGVSSARNRALRKCRGRYIQFLDADDILGEPECLLKRVRLLEKLPLKSIVVCRTDTFEQLFRRGKPKVNGHWYIFTDKLDLHLCRLNIAPPHAFLFGCELIKDIGLFKEHYGGCEDYDFWLRALGQGYHFYYCGNTKVFYRKHLSSKGAKKARLGAFPFDVEVHTQMHTGAYGKGVTNILQTNAGKLAMACGTLATAVKINPEANPSGQLYVAELAYHYLKSALDEMSTDITKCSLETRLFVRRLLCQKSSVASLNYFPLSNVMARLSKKACRPLIYVTDILEAFPYTKIEQQALMYFLLKSLLP